MSIYKNKTSFLEDFIGKTLVVLVIHEMPLERSPAFHSLCLSLRPFEGASSIFVYDNSSKSQLFKEQNWGSITYVHDASNGGVSKAYNKAFEYAKSVGKQWLLFADQDTVFPDNFFLEFSEEVRYNHRQEVFVPIMRDELGVVSPFRFTMGRGVRVKKVTTASGKLRLARWNFINSGLLVSIALFEKCGGYDERFILDYSDLSFHKRLTRFISSMQLVDVSCVHSLSSNQQQDEDNVLKRFYIYSHSSREFSAVYNNYFILIVMLLRSIKLSFKFSTTRFAITGWKYLLSKNPSLPSYEA